MHHNGEVLILHSLRQDDHILGYTRPDTTSVLSTDLYKYSPDAVHPIHAISYHVATDKPPPKMATSSGLFLATIYNQSQLVERKHVARYWLINTAATAVPLVITMKLAAAILGERLFRGGVLPAQYCPCNFVTQ